MSDFWGGDGGIMSVISWEGVVLNREIHRSNLLRLVRVRSFSLGWNCHPGSMLSVVRAPETASGVVSDFFGNACGRQMHGMVYQKGLEIRGFKHTSSRKGPPTDQWTQLYKDANNKRFLNSKWKHELNEEQQWNILPGTLGPHLGRFFRPICCLNISWIRPKSAT